MGGRCTHWIGSAQVRPQRADPDPQTTPTRTAGFLGAPIIHSTWEYQFRNVQWPHNYSEDPSVSRAAKLCVVLPKGRFSRTIRELRAKQAPGMPRFRAEPGFLPKRTLLAHEVRTNSSRLEEEKHKDISFPAFSPCVPHVRG